MTRLNYLARCMHFVLIMYFNIVPDAPFGLDRGVRNLVNSTGGSSPFAVGTLERVRNALDVAPVRPLPQADWAELRANVSAMRPSPPPRLFSRANSFFGR